MAIEDVLSPCTKCSKCFKFLCAIDKLVPMKGYAENKYVKTDGMFSEITIYHNLTPQVLE